MAYLGCQEELSVFWTLPPNLSKTSFLSIPTPPGKVYFPVNVDQLSLQEYIRNQMGWRPPTFRQLEDNLNLLSKWKMT